MPGPGNSGMTLLILAFAHRLVSGGPTVARVEISRTGQLVQQRLVRSHAPQDDEDAGPEARPGPAALGEGGNGTAAGEAPEEEVQEAEREKGAPSKEASESGRPTFVVAPPAKENVLVVVPNKAGALIEEGGTTPPPLVVAPPAGDNVVVVMPDAGKNESLGGEAAPSGQNLAEDAERPTYALTGAQIRASAGGPHHGSPVVVAPIPGKNVLVIMPGNAGGSGAGAAPAPAGGAEQAPALAEVASAADPSTTNAPFVVAPPHGENLVVVVPEPEGGLHTA